MIDVRIRTDGDTTAVPLCKWPAAELDDLLPMIGSWGVYREGNTYTTAELVGQIHADEFRAYFEIVVITGDE